MGDIVQTEDQDVQDDQGQLGRAVDGRDEGEEGEQGVAHLLLLLLVLLLLVVVVVVVAHQEHPGDDLLGVQRQLEPVQPPPFPELLDRGAGPRADWHPEASYW